MWRRRERSISRRARRPRRSRSQLINDTLPEGAEAFSLALSGLVGATALNPVGTAVIAANDEPIVSKAAISIDDVIAGEQDDFADFVIRLDAPTSAPVTVDYDTVNSTANYRQRLHLRPRAR